MRFAYYARICSASIATDRFENDIANVEKAADAHRSDADARGARTFDRRLFPRSPAVYHGGCVGGDSVRDVMAVVLALASAFPSPRLARRFADARDHYRRP